MKKSLKDTVRGFPVPSPKPVFVSFSLSFSPVVEYFGTWLRFAFFRLASSSLVRVLDDVTPNRNRNFSIPICYIRAVFEFGIPFVFVRCRQMRLRQRHRRFRRRRVPFSGICRSFRPGAVLIGSSVGNMLAANYSSASDTKHSSLSVCSPALLFLFSYCDILPTRACYCWLQVFLRIRERNRCISASSRHAIRI